MALGPRTALVLLPGLDGTGRLFSRFVAHLAEELEPRVVPLPADRALGYPELVRLVRDRLPLDRPFALLGESFCGPVALQLAAERPPGLRALILVASFHRRPVAWWGRAVKPLAGLLLSRPPPAWAARLFLAGRDAPADLVRELQRAVAEVAPNVLAARVRPALAVDATAALATCPVPLLYLGGSRDRIVRHSVVREMQRVQPSMQHRRFDAPHLLLQRAPADSGVIISSFLHGLE
jgi:pimeloyl-ACP methyl ester carboxylesterase